MEDKTLLISMIQIQVNSIVRYADFPGFDALQDVQGKYGHKFKNRQITRFLRLSKKLEDDIMDVDERAHLKYYKEQSLKQKYLEENTHNYKKVMAAFDSEFASCDYKNIASVYKKALQDRHGHFYGNIGPYLKNKAQVKRLERKPKFSHKQYLEQKEPITESQAMQEFELLDQIYDIDLKDKDTVSKMKYGTQVSTKCYENLEFLFKKRGFEFEEKVSFNELNKLLSDDSDDDSQFQREVTSNSKF